jgi:DNA polymerase III subunit gamma/tau
MLGTISRDHVERLAEQLASLNASEIVKCARSLEEFSPDYAQVLDELAGLLVRVAMKQTVSDFDGDDLYAPELLERLAKALSPEDIQLFYQTAIIGRRDLALAPDPRTGFEMTLLRMIAFRPTSDAGVSQGPASGTGSGRGSSVVAARAAAQAGAGGGAISAHAPTPGAPNGGSGTAPSAGASAGNGVGTGGVAGAAGGAAAARAAAQAGLGGAAAARAAAQAAATGSAASARAPTQAGTVSAAGSGGGAAARSATEPPREALEGATQASAAPDQGDASWVAILNQLDLQGAARELARHCVLVGRQAGLVRLGLDPRVKFVRTSAQEEKLAQALSRHYGETVRLEFSAAAADVETPAQAELRASQQELETARQAFETDPAVQGLRERFGATLLPDTIRPLK